MIHRHVLDSRLKTLTLAALTLMVAAQIIVWRPLFADGAFLLMRILHTRHFHDVNEFSRALDYRFTQLPVIVALRLGVTNLDALTWIFCFWMITSFMIFWLAALWLLRKDFLFWPFAALFTVAYFNGGFFTVGEYNLDYALTAFCLAVTLRRRENSPALYGLLLAAACLSTLTYASTMFLGAVLAAVAIIRALREPNPIMKLYWLALIAIFLISAGIGAWGYIDPNHQENKNRAGNAAILLYDCQFWVTIVAAFLAALQFLLPWRSARTIIFLLLLALATLTLTGMFTTHPVVEFGVRAYTGLALCGGFALLGWFRFWGYRKILSAERLKVFDPVRTIAVPVFALLLVLVFFDLSRSKDFKPYLDSFRAELNSHTGVIPWESTMAFVRNDRLFGWSWTYPSMSLILRRSPDAAIIANARRSAEEQPFDPYHPPDLSAYYH